MSGSAMHMLRRPAGARLILAILCVCAAINVDKPHVTHAASHAWLRAAKDSQPILPRAPQRQASVPSTTFSFYESSTAATRLYNQGCSAARGAPGLIILDWGQPVYVGHNTYGTFDFGGRVVSDALILQAAASFVRGVWNCRTTTTNIALALGESNYFSDHAIPLTAAAWYADGQQWGNMVNDLQSFITGNHFSVVGANGAGDLEVEWANFALTSSMVDGYNSVTRHVYFDFGDASPGWWSNYQIWYVAYGARDNLPLPEIYYPADAFSDWEPLDLWACSHAGGPIYFKGTIAEQLAGSNSPFMTFFDLSTAEASNSCTARDLPGLIFSTEIIHA